MSERPRGVDRSDDPLLSLQDDDQKVRRAVMSMGRAMWTTTLMATKAPLGRETFERMQNPQPGDYVGEHTAMHRAYNGHDPSAWYQGFGILLEQSEDVYGSEVWYVQYGPAPDDVCRWGNATMIALPALKGAPAPA